MVGGDLSAHISLKSYFLKLRCLRCIKMLEEAQMGSKTLHFRSSHVTHTAWAVGRCTNTHSTWYVWDTCHTHSMGCGPLHQHPQHMVCMVHMPHTQHGLWVDTQTPTGHGMYGTHATHTHTMSCGSMHQHQQNEQLPNSLIPRTLSKTTVLLYKC